MRVGLLAHSARAGDAIGRQIAAKVAFVRDRGAEVRVVVATDRELDPALRPFTARFTAQDCESLVAWLRSADLVLIEYSQHTPVLELIPLVAGGNAKLI